MGQRGLQLAPIHYVLSEVSTSLFDFIEVIGRGGVGKVWKVQYRQTKRLLAIKEMSKIRIMDKKLLNNIFKEREILSSIYHPYDALFILLRFNRVLVNMYCCFQDKANLYLVLDYMPGGDLRYYNVVVKQFSEEQIKFCIGCVIIGLEYIHSKGIIHRDIKPENLIFDESGYLRITDFGISRKVQAEDCNDISGTNGYIAPECLLSDTYSYEVDYFALGVVCYELLMKDKPYSSKKSQIKDEYRSKEIRLTPDQLPKGFSPDLCSFVNALLKVNPQERLGHFGIGELKEHKWYKGFSWFYLENKFAQSPLAGKLKQRSEVVTIQEKKHKEKSKSHIDTANDSYRLRMEEDPNFQSNFNNFTFIESFRNMSQRFSTVGLANSHRPSKVSSNLIRYNKFNRNILQSSSFLLKDLGKKRLMPLPSSNFFRLSNSKEVFPPINSHPFNDKPPRCNSILSLSKKKPTLNKIAFSSKSSRNLFRDVSIINKKKSP